LKEAGLRLVCVGFESGDQGILNAINKKISIEQFYQFRRAATQARVLVHGCFMAGNPGETRQSLNKTLQLAKNLNPDTAQFLPIMVYPGTVAYDWAIKNRRLDTTRFGDWLTKDGLHKSIISYPDLSSEDIVKWCDDARRSFYLRPKYILNKLIEMVTHPSESYRIIKSALSLFHYIFRSSIRE
jgi:radical SAM superfamily enzyme YgiQ (UPF0313 family)